MIPHLPSGLRGPSFACIVIHHPGARSDPFRASITITITITIAAAAAAILDCLDAGLEIFQASTHIVDGTLHDGLEGVPSGDPVGSGMVCATTFLLVRRQGWTGGGEGREEIHGGRGWGQAYYV